MSVFRIVIAVTADTPDSAEEIAAKIAFLVQDRDEQVFTNAPTSTTVTVIEAELVSE